MNKLMVERRFVVGLAAATLLVSLSPGARADDAAPKPAAATAAELTAAKKHYADGEKKYKAADFEGALGDFKLADDVKATPQAERYIGLCEDALGHYGAAIDWYDKFLAHVPDKMAPAADELKKREAEIKAMPGKVHVESTPPGAAVVVDDKAAPSPTPFDIELAPGSHKMTFSAAGRLPADKPVDVAFASTQAVAVELPVEPPPAAPPPVLVAVAPPAPSSPPPAPAAPARSPVPAYITGAIAVAAAGVGTVFGVIALNDKSNFDKTPTASTADDGDTHALIADMAFGIALTFGVTSAVLFLTKDEVAPGTSAVAPSATRIASDGANKPKTRHLPSWPIVIPAAMVGPHLGGASFTVRF